jgi:hypothetical protein
LLSKINKMSLQVSFVEVTPSMVKSKGSVDAAMIDQLLLKVV